jgi:hypothetical protein
MKLEEQIRNFTTLRGYPPRVVSVLPSGKGAIEDWRGHALFLSEQEGYSYALILLTIDRYLLLRTCEQDFHHQILGSEWFLHPVGQYVGWTHLGWTHSQLRWFFTWRLTEDLRTEIISEIDEIL